MTRVYISGVLLSVIFLTVCSGDEVMREISEKRNEEIAKEGKAEKEMLARLDEFKSLTAPVKPVKPYFVSKPVILVKLPGGEFEIEGWEKDEKGDLKRCPYFDSNTSDCNGHKLVWQKDQLASSDPKSLLRADCTRGAKLMDLELIGIPAGPLHSTVCKMTVIDLPTKRTVFSGDIVVDKIIKGANGNINKRDIVQAADKKGYLVAPYNGILNLTFDLAKS
jgi:hypothetical protein